MEKLLVVDGSNLLFQMFYGMPSRIFNKEGKAIHGTLGFMGAFLKIVRMTAPTHVVVLFDGECHNERCDLDAAYKANRPDFSVMPEEETPFSQLPDIYKALDYLKVPYIETTVCETDDIVGAYAKRYGKEMQIVISSFDSDFFQLIDDNVCILRYRGDKTQICDREYLRDKFGIAPEQYADFKSLTGDNADNIKGAGKIGPKTASKLLKEFGTLDALMGNAERISQASVRASILNSMERLRINQKMITLDGSAELPFTVSELQWQYNGETSSEVLSAVGVK